MTLSGIVLSVVRQAHERGIEARELPRGDVQRVVDVIRSRYGSAPRAMALWEQLGPAVSMHDSHGWARVGRFMTGQAVVMIIDDIDGPSGVELPDSRDLTGLLSETEGFVFYVTDSGVSYVLAFNDHDVLIAVGTAAEWLSSEPRPPGD